MHNALDRRVKAREERLTLERPSLQKPVSAYSP